MRVEPIIHIVDYTQDVWSKDYLLFLKHLVIMALIPLWVERRCNDVTCIFDVSVTILLSDPPRPSAVFYPLRVSCLVLLQLISPSLPMLVANQGQGCWGSKGSLGTSNHLNSQLHL